MNTITQLPVPALTQAHRDAMAYIQDLAITISQQGTYAVHASYSGINHEYTAHIVLFEDFDKGIFRARTVLNAHLPGHRQWSWMGATALEDLQTMARELEALLTPPTGDAA